MNIFVIIPFHNEEKNIAQVLTDLKKYKFPIVMVDDGSTDRSKSKVLNLKLKNLTLLSHRVNLGKGAALKTGCDYAFANGAQAVIMMDSDGQHNPQDITRFTEKLLEGYDVVLGSRNLGMGVPLERYIGNKMASVLVGMLFHVYVSDIICGFRALTKMAYQKINWESAGYGVETEMVVKMRRKHLKHCEVPVETIYYDGFKGVSIIDAFSVFLNVIKWKLNK